MTLERCENKTFEEFIPESYDQENSPEELNTDRRQVLKKFAAGTAALAGCSVMPERWTSPVLRLDIPLLNPPEDNSKTDETVLQAVKATNIWTYPGQDYPLPVILAHEKCNIREGCAQVLYEEIITKSRTVDPYNQLILTQLR